jgi:hypothetical protein
MRALAGLIAAGLCLAAATSLADPKPADRYAAATIRLPGAIFGGLAKAGDDIVVTNLADGRIYRRGLDGTFMPFGPTLPHGKDVMGEPTGPYHLLADGDGWLVTQGWTPADAAEGAYDHALLRIDKAGGVTVVSRDFWNPFDLVRSGDGYFVVDAGHNSIERLAPDGTELGTLFTFAKLVEREGALKHLSPTEFAGGKTYEVDAVPTGIALHDGRLFVALFGGFPFLPGSGRVVSIEIGETAAAARVETVDLNAPVDVAFDEDGGMLVLESGIYDGESWGDGRLIHIDRAGKDRQTLVDGLKRPFALLVEDRDHIVISQLDGALVFLSRANP